MKKERSGKERLLYASVADPLTHYQKDQIDQMLLELS